MIRDPDQTDSRMIVAGEATGLTMVAVVAALLTAIGLPTVVRVPTSPTMSIVLHGQVQFSFLFVAAGYLYIRGNPSRYVRFCVPTVRDIVWLGGLLGLIPLLSSPNREWFVTKALAETPGLWLVVFVFWFLIQVPAEELLFRGIVQGRLRDAFSPLVAVGLGAVLFGSMHVPFAAFQGGTTNLSSVFVMQSIMGAVFGGVYERTDNLVVPIVAHSVLWISPAILHLFAIT